MSANILNSEEKMLLKIILIHAIFFVFIFISFTAEMGSQGNALGGGARKSARFDDDLNHHYKKLITAYTKQKDDVFGLIFCFTYKYYWLNYFNIYYHLHELISIFCFQRVIHNDLTYNSNIKIFSILKIVTKIILKYKH